MSDTSDNKKTAPPYVPAATLWNFLAGLKQAPPPQIDRTLMKTLGGSTQFQLLHALKYLDLIEENGNMTPQLEKLILSEGSERKSAIDELLRLKYPFVNEGSGFDLKVATPQQLRDEFENLGAKGDTYEKCQRFFLSLATEAGYSISPYIKTPPTTNGKSTPGKPRARKPKRHQEQNQGATPPVDPPANVTRSIDEILLGKFPDFDITWDDVLKKAWFEAYADLRNRTKPVT